MGLCFSQDLEDDSSAQSPRSARVISISGELHEYRIPFRVSQVLESERTSSSSSSSSSSGFVCSSDSLYYEEFIPALANEDELVQNQIYFVLPRSKLQHRLTASDMAALAVKATVAMQKASSRKGVGPQRRRKTQIAPFLVVNQRTVSDYRDINELEVKRGGNRLEKTAPAALSRSGSVRKMQRQSSRRLKKAVRSFRIRLSTIEEGSGV
ncbi:hypothetical protein BT93_H0692 [Corymbia citriodora subsp. variegata]|nr:hypothetical protein BT93_H0692 [Corymbia citriodora subsp. variegata]